MKSDLGLVWCCSLARDSGCRVEEMAGREQRGELRGEEALAPQPDLGFSPIHHVRLGQVPGPL